MHFHIQTIFKSNILTYLISSFGVRLNSLMVRNINTVKDCKCYVL